MSILVNKHSRVLVQGFTGKEASFHAQQMIEYGTNIVGGTSPGKNGKIHLERPVFDTMQEAVNFTGADVSIIFVPPASGADAIMEAAESGIRLIITITEGIPVKDMILVNEYLKDKNCRLIGPNCPGIITPGECKVGIMPGFIHRPGKIGIISKSGTLTYEAVNQVTKLGMGQSTCVGIGGDPIIGSSILDIIKLMMDDKDTEGIVIIGEIGGPMETEAAEWLKESKTKPVVAFIAGVTAPKGKRMGHAGAIINGKDDTAIAKIEILMRSRIEVAESAAMIGQTIKKAVGK